MYNVHVRIQTDFLVIGGGLAGLRAALLLAKSAKVVLLSKRPIQESATAYAQGGIASVMSTHDSFNAHVQDTLEAGAGLCHRDVVESIVTDGPKAIETLTALGVSFDQHDGTYDLTREGGHSERRILHSQDVTGREIVRALYEGATRESNIRIFDNQLAIDLIVSAKLQKGGANRCLGAYVFDTQTAEVHTIRARATLLATGGAGKVYLYTSNPDAATGDGVAMAFRAGATISNMEFFQFHPTVLFHAQSKSFLISEALRGEGGILRRRDGTALMHGKHPLADLAPRDVVARAIDEELKKSGADYVVLDMTHRDPAFLAARFPNIHAACLALGIDMTKVAIPVVPAAHYMCGGVRSDLQGRTDVLGLYVAGESACTGLHGANRLASNSLLEAAVMSERAAKQALNELDTGNEMPIPDWDPGKAENPDEMVVVSHNWDELRRTMWNYVGIVRSDKRLLRAQHRIELLQREIHEFYWNFKLTADLIELRNLATVASLIVASAQTRRESRGLHYNIDVPNLHKDWRRDTLAHRGKGGKVVVEQAPS